MDLSSLKRGQEVKSGFVYRRIPNSEAHYDYDEALPEPATFLLRPQDEGALSTHLDEKEALAALADPRHAGYGLCAFDIDTIRRESAGRMRVVFFPTRRSPSHARIYGCHEEEMRVLLAAIAEMVQEPDKETRQPY